jgi:UDP-N-acetylglucosamine 2-epimerase (non-hydrolysing)
VGDLLFQKFLQRAAPKNHNRSLEELGLAQGDYLFVTCHRAETVDNREGLAKVIDILLSLDIPMVFPVHPRTKQRLTRFGLWRRLRAARQIRLTDPLNHETALTLIEVARAVLTDSGGVQREAYWLRTPCLTLRDRTEWTELVDCGANKVVGLNLAAIRRGLERPQSIRLVDDHHFRKRRPAVEIVQRLQRLLANQ